MDRQRKKTNPPNYILGLDGLRAIAVGGVVLYHLFPNIIKGGYLGVILFFAISGYLMVITSEADWEKKRFTFLGFYKKRLKRIYPAMAVTLVIFTAFAALVTPAALGGIRAEILSIFLGYNNWWQIAQHASYFSKAAAASPFTHLWSLAIELQYYLIWPLLYLGYKQALKTYDQKKTDLAFLAVALVSGILMAVLYSPTSDPSRVYYGTDTRIFALLMGAFAGIKHRERLEVRYKESEKAILNGLFVLCTLGVLCLYIKLDGQSAAAYRGGMFFAGALFAVIVALTGSAELSVGRWLDNPVLNWFGRRSYEIYLIQYPVIFFWSKIRPESENVFLPLIPGLIILILSALLHFVLDYRNHRQFGKYFRHNKRQAAICAAITLAVLGIFVYGLATAPSDRLTADQRALQQSLEENAKMLKEQQNQQHKEAQTKDGDTAPKTDEKSEVDPLADSVTIVGDSVVLGAAPALQQKIPAAVIDAKEGRQVKEGPDILKTLDSQGRLGKTVIIALGANGPFSAQEGQAILDVLGKDRQVYWVTVCGTAVSWQNEVNAAIRDLASKNKNMHVVDWDQAGPSHSQWFYDDGLHLNPEGQTGFADFLVNAVRNATQ